MTSAAPAGEQPKEAPEEESDRFGTFVAILIAVVAVVGALIAWRASVADDGAGDAYRDGMRAVLNVEEARARNAVTAYADYSAFLNYRRNNRLAELIEADMAATDDEALLAQLDQQRAGYTDIAIASESLFSQRYLNRDGTYAVDRQLSQLQADSERAKDLSPQPKFDEGRQLEGRAMSLLGAVTILGLALVLYTLVESMGGVWRYIMTGAGTIAAVAGVVIAIIAEYGM